MTGLLYFAVCFVKALLSLLRGFVFLSAILSEIPTRITDSLIFFVLRLGDFVVYPARRVCKSIRLSGLIPVDASYIITISVLYLIEVFLPNVTVI